MGNFAVILPAAGSSRRFNSQAYKKQFAPLADRAVWLHSLDKFVNRSEVKQLMVVIDPEDRELFQMRFSANIAFLSIDVVEGGAERADSVQKALERLKPEIDYVCIHDAARPCVATAWIDEVFQAAEKTGAAILAVPLTGTIKRAGRDQRIQETVPRDGLWEAQTPQVFRRDVLLTAYAKRAGFLATDDAQLVERSGHPVALVPGSPLNLKISTQQDLKLAEQVLKVLPKPKLTTPSHPFANEDFWK